MKSTVTEKHIENVILLYLNARKIMVWKSATQSVFDPKFGGFRRVSNEFHLLGISDILGILPNGRFLAIEVKKPDAHRSIIKNYGTLKFYSGADKNKLRHRNQIQFIENIKINGGLAFFASDIEHVKQSLG